MRYWGVEREEIDLVLVGGGSGGGLRSGTRPWVVGGNGYQGQVCGSVDFEGGGGGGGGRDCRRKRF